jgi:hypothetical protein
VIHFGLMCLYAFLVASFFALLSRAPLRDRVRLFCLLFFGLVGGALALGWLMYPFPGSPPAPIP